MGGIAVSTTLYSHLRIRLDRFLQTPYCAHGQNEIIDSARLSRLLGGTNESCVAVGGLVSEMTNISGFVWVSKSSSSGGWLVILCALEYLHARTLLRYSPLTSDLLWSDEFL